MNKQIGWIILSTKNFGKSLEFYRNKLKLKVIRIIEKEEFYQFDMGNCFLAIYGEMQLKKLVGIQYIQKAGGAIYSFKDSVDIDKDYQQLVKQGVNFILPPKTQPWGQKTAYFLDPDEHIWELQQWENKDV